MGRCLFASCNSDTKQRDLAFFRLPVTRDVATAKLWLSRAKRADLKFASLPKSAVVCSLHFFEDQLVSELFGTRQRLRVIDGEIPFPNGVTPFSTSTRARRSRSTQQVPVRMFCCILYLIKYNSNKII